MLSTLENEYWYLKVSAKGAWLHTLAAKVDGSKHQDLLVPGEEALSGSWQHAGMPFLFPFAGRSYVGDQVGFINFENKLYPMPIHGFAHLQDWKHEKSTLQNSSQITLSLRSADIQENFPFKFEVCYHFCLNARQIELRVEVHNLGDRALPVASGWHPYFQSQILAISSIAEFIGRQSAFRVNDRGLLSRQEPILSKYDPQLPEWQSAIVECHEPIRLNLNRKIKLECHPSLRTLTIWSPKPDLFVCLEPWMANPNSYMEGRALSLAPLQSLKCSTKFSL